MRKCSIEQNSAHLSRIIFCDCTAHPFLFLAPHGLHAEGIVTDVLGLLGFGGSMKLDSV